MKNFTFSKELKMAARTFGSAVWGERVVWAKRVLPFIHELKKY